MTRRARTRGQTVLMLALSLVAMFGLLGLAVDLGWAFFVKRTAQASADSAVMAAARKAFASSGQAGPFSCTTGACATGSRCFACETTAVACSTLLGNGTNLANGCLYSARNGFSSGGANGSQHVWMASNSSNSYDTGDGVITVKYWVRSTAVQTIPQLFSVLLGKTSATVSARAVAAVLDVIVDGSLILLNRSNDAATFGGTTYYGLNLQVQANNNQGQDALLVSGAIRMASDCHGVSTGPTNCFGGNKTTYVGQNQGGGTAKATGGIAVAGMGDLSASNGASWDPYPPQRNAPQLDH